MQNKLILGALAWLALAQAQAAPPPWWSSRHVFRLDPQTSQPVPADDFRLLNQGQLKHLAAAAYDEMQAALPGGAGSDVETLIKKWFQLDSAGNFALDPVTGTRMPNTTGAADGFATVNVGQLKTVAKPFFTRLIQLGYTSTYPWVGAAQPADDFAYANIGQAKNLFKFSFPDADGDGLPDFMEVLLGTSSSTHVTGSNPHPDGWDTDGDGVSDGEEVRLGRSPTKGAITDATNTIVGLQVYAPAR